MQRFAQGSEQQFAWLRDQIQGALYIFKDVTLPTSCVPRHCRMGFEFTPEYGYKAYIDKNITFSGSHEAFARFINSGEEVFETYPAMVTFVRGLGCLFTEARAAKRGSFTCGASADETAEIQAPASEESARDARAPIDVDYEQLYKGLTSRIIGQDSALAGLADATHIHLAQLKPKRPSTIFMAGPTGVGKTESVYALADTLNRLAHIKFELIRIDCNQFVESHRIAQLLGAPPGYVGYGEPAALAPLAENPRCIVLWDEIEKAHANVLKVLMSTMDAGKIKLPTPINGIAELDCEYAIFIFTSNLSMNPAGSQIGFTDVGKTYSTVESDEDRCKKALVKNGVGPEIAGRIAWFLNYVTLSKDDVAKVIRLEIEACAASFGLTVKRIIATIIDEIILSTSSEFGMRAYKQLIDRRFGKGFAAFKRQSASVEIGGSLNALSITACWPAQD